MGTVFKKQTTRPVPPGAEIIVRKGERLARWKVKGKARLAPLTVGQDGGERIVTEAATYTAKFRDGAGLVQEVATGCRDADAARQVLADLERHRAGQGERDNPGRSDDRRSRDGTACRASRRIRATLAGEGRYPGPQGEYATLA